MRKLTLVIAMMVFVALLAACGSSGDDGDGDSAAAPPPAAPPPAAAAPDIPAGAIQVTNRDQGGSGKYEFSPKEFKFSVGQEVTFALTSETEFHTFSVDELSIDQTIDPGETKLFTTTFDKAGTYPLYCIPHQALGMTGEIVVE